MLILENVVLWAFLAGLAYIFRQAYDSLRNRLLRCLHE